MIHIAALKKDMIILEKSEFFALRNENEVYFGFISFQFIQIYLIHIYFLFDFKKLVIELKNLRDQMHVRWFELNLI